ncbi:hypothetical protein [Clostridium drakei]|uniref:Uncharacterized protein n=1 Tax=Clostridium drakei TaxID=332101 RepID=A0A2U8DKU5_9CLOT|nr:hypothetical protein [Clostridium drakei]AWI03095.1 hypothetical protein B9W14_00755 [Clostridium drakei]
MNKRNFLLISFISLLISISISSQAYAKVTHAIVKDKSGLYYKYNYPALADSLVSDGILYDSFISKINDNGKLFAYLDDKVGFVNSDDVCDAVIIQGKDFQQFIDKSQNTSSVININGDFKAVSMKDGKLVEEDESTSIKDFTLEADSSTMLGFTYLKIKFVGANSTDYVVKYDSQQAMWSEQFNCFIIQFNGTHSATEYSKEKVEITNNNQAETEFDLENVQ